MHILKRCRNHFKLPLIVQGRGTQSGELLLHILLNKSLRHLECRSAYQLLSRPLRQLRTSDHFWSQIPKAFLFVGLPRCLRRLIRTRTQWCERQLYWHHESLHQNFHSIYKPVSAVKAFSVFILDSSVGSFLSSTGCSCEPSTNFNLQVKWHIL